MEDYLKVGHGEHADHYTNKAILKEQNYTNSIMFLKILQKHHK